jgi:polar amino acid transport system permease protein
MAGGGGPGISHWGAGDPRNPQPDEESSASKILGPMRASGARGVAIATVSTIVVLTFIAVVVVNSPNWLLFKQSFFNGSILRYTLPDIAHAFLRNIEYFLIAEPVILILALTLAVMRSLPGPVFFPIRAMAIFYIDLFRGIPTILVVYLLGFGVPALQIPGVPNNAVFWGVVGLVMSYSAYVAEVYRAGIESVHPSQTAAARSLGLTRWLTLRYVVVPQAVRRVVPPLMNDFIALQKDTALIAIVSGFPPEAFLQGQIYQNATFNFTPIVGVALCFLIITVPQTRFADWLVARQRAKRQGGGVM